MKQILYLDIDGVVLPQRAYLLPGQPTLDSSSEWKHDTIKNITSFYLIEPETPLERMLRIQSELNTKYPDINSIPDHVATEIADVLEGYL